MAPRPPNDPQDNTPINVFPDANGVEVTGTVNIHVENTRTNVAVNLSGRSPWEILLSHCAFDALVDSNERYDPPRCAPETRVAIQQQIIDWILQLTLSGLVMWLSGSAGSGKSAVAQTIAERFNHRETPSTSFFFSRISGSPTRVDGNRLLPTIIYQFCLLLPEYKASVLKKIEKDPAIFQRSRGAQMAALITKPLQQFSFRRWLREFRGGRSLPLLIIIDGLDECRDPQVQCDILRIIADAAASCRSRPLRFLVASRPEAHIAHVFDQYPNFKEVGLRRINFDDDEGAFPAILTFLRQEFGKIHEQHPLRFHLDPSWPGQDILDFLVSKSSPQFVLASTAMAYVSSPKHHPKSRLATIIGILETSSTAMLKHQPLEKLDLLYKMIFSGIEEKHRILVQALLGIIHLASLEEYSIPPPTPQSLEKLLNLERGEVCLRLEPLASVLHVPEPDLDLPIRFLHASLFDFLLNPSRSHGLVLNLVYARAGLIGHELLKDPDCVTTRRFAQELTTPIARMSLEGLLTNLLLNDPSHRVGHPERTAYEDVLTTAVKMGKIVNLCLDLLKSWYARQGLFKVKDDVDSFVCASLGIYYRKGLIKLVNFESCEVELKHCLYQNFLPMLGSPWTIDQLRDHQDLILHCLLYQLTMSSSLTIISWTPFCDAIQGLNPNWAVESGEVKELARLCRNKVQYLLRHDIIVNQTLRQLENQLGLLLATAVIIST